jgi:hypothetical protein
MNATSAVTTDALAVIIYYASPSCTTPLGYTVGSYKATSGFGNYAAWAYQGTYAVSTSPGNSNGNGNSANSNGNGNGNNGNGNGNGGNNVIPTTGPSLIAYTSTAPPVAATMTITASGTASATASGTATQPPASADSSDSKKGCLGMDCGVLAAIITPVSAGLIGGIGYLFKIWWESRTGTGETSDKKKKETSDEKSKETSKV